MLLLTAAEGGPPAPLLLGWQLGASVSLWRWAEAGAAFSGRWDLQRRAHHAGPTELWLRAGPPDLRGVAAQLFVEQATGRGGFDLDGTIWPSTTTLGALLGWQRWRFDLGASLAYQAAGEDLATARYHGLQATGAAWLTVAHAGAWGLQLGGEVLARAGGAEGLRGALDVAWSFAAGVRLLDEHGAAFAAGYGQGSGGLPSRIGYVKMGYSYGKGYIVPPPDPEFPPLLPMMQEWIGEQLRQLFAPRPAAPPLELGPGLGELLGPVGDYCTAPPFGARMPAALSRACVLHGPPVVWNSRRGPLVAAWREDTAWAAQQVGHALFYGGTGIACGVAEGLAPAFRCFDPRDGAFQLGRGLGSIGAGIVQGLLGGGGEVLGAGLDLSGAGALAGVPVAVGSAAVALNGMRAIRAGARDVTEAVISAMTHRVASAPVSKAQGSRKPRSPNGCNGNPDHQETVRQLTDRAKSEFPDGGRYEIRGNKSIEKESGVRRRPDVAVIDKAEKRVVKVYEAARANKDGVTPVSRERKKVQEYDDKGIPSHVVIVR